MDQTNTCFINASDYEFLDFGCSAGGSLDRYGTLFNANGKGLGLDISPEKVKLTKEKGFNAQVCDITKIQLSAKVRFCIMHHFLEHISSLNDVNTIIRKACSIVSEFVLIRQPYFDSDPYLFQHGFKLYWSNWRGHPNNMTLLELHNILKPMVLEGLISRFSLYGLDPVTSSENPVIHNLDSEIDQHAWNIQEHTPKKIIDFTFPVYKETMAIIDISGNSTEKIESIFKPPEKFFVYKRLSNKTR